MSMLCSRLAAIFVVATSLASAAGALADPISPPPAPLCKVPSAGAKITAVFQPKVALRDLATWFYSFSCKKVVFASELGDVSASVTVIGDGAMTVKQATALFGNSLTAAGLQGTVQGDTWIVTRDPKAPCPTSNVAVGVGNVDWKAVRDHARTEFGITVVDDTHRSIRRAAIVATAADFAKATAGVRVVPIAESGSVVRYKLYAIRATSLANALGLSNGDLVATWNGTALSSPDVVQAQLATLATAKRVELGVIRRGTSLTLIYDLTD